MCTLIPQPIFPVSDLGGSILWVSVLSTLVLFVLLLQPIYVWSRKYANAETRVAARVVSSVVGVFAGISFFSLRVPFVVVSVALLVAFVFTSVMAFRIVHAPDARSAYVPFIVFITLALVAAVGWFLSTGMCGTDSWPDYFIADGHSWNELDEIIASLEYGQVIEFTARDPLACDACPEAPAGHYVAYRCEEIVVQRTGAESLDSVVFSPEHASELLVNVTYDSTSDEMIIDGSCPLEYVPLDGR